MSISNTFDAVIQKMSAIALEHPGVESAVAFPGLSPNGFSVSSNEGIVFVTLKTFEERTSPDMSADAIAGALNMQFGVISDAFVVIFPPPPVIGLGTTGGFKLQIEDRANLGYERLYQEAQKVVGQAWQTPELTQTFSFFQVNVPQIEIDIDREKAKQLGATDGVLYNEEKWEQRLRKQCPSGFDVIIDSAGGEGFGSLVKLLGMGGRLVFFGGTKGRWPAILPQYLFFKQVSILASTMGSLTEFSEMLQFIENHQLKPIIDSVFPLESHDKALEQLVSADRFGKIILQID